MKKRLQNSFYKARMNPITKQKQYKKENYTSVSLRNTDIKISNNVSKQNSAAYEKNSNP